MSSGHWEFNNVNEAFMGMAQNLFEHGEEVSPRGKKTLELHPVTIEILNPTDAIIVHPDRKMNYGFLAMEPIWMLSGDEEPWIVNHMKSLTRFMDKVNGRDRLMGAYGPRIRSRFGIDQFEYVVSHLKEKPDSRQATVVIWDPFTDTKGYKDAACTNLIRFMIRNGKLDMTVFMRSNDAWLGASYDFFTFCLFQHLIASVLKVPVGTYFHMADSYHVYEENIPNLELILKNPDRKIDSGVPSLSTMDYDTLSDAYADAKWGKDLLGTRHTPPHGRYLTRLMKSVLDRTKNPEPSIVK